MLRDRAYTVSVVYAINDDIMQEAVDSFSPELIISPYLTRKIPQRIWENVPVIIIHPGPLGDRGPSSLDWAVLNKVEKWGITALQANAEMDAGDIWATRDFVMRSASKASHYRKEVSDLALELVDEVIEKFHDKNFSPLPQSTLRGVSWHIHSVMKQSSRMIDWEHDSSDTIIQKIHASDSHPGVLDELLGVTCYLYGVHKEGDLRGAPKSILAKRDGAICLGTKDGAVWISHLKEPHRFKLPATYVLKERLKGIKEVRIPLYVSPSLETFKEITYVQKGRVGYLGFDFYNGAMSAEQCIRLKYAIEVLKEEVDILVLLGGKNFFSNGIHLGILEDSAKQGEDGWSNINAMNNLIRTILFSDDVLTIASFGANAGAGGVFLGLACDVVVARESVVLNPHYKSMGLSGSEYHTYTLPKRVTEPLVRKILDETLPLSTRYALEIGMLDAVLPNDTYESALEAFCESIDEDQYYALLDKKSDILEKERSFIHTCKENELQVMHPEFWDESSAFHGLRREFIYKICPTQTPQRLIYA